MRVYIFTERERQIIHRILKGEKVEELAEIKYRILHFKRLESDVELYLKLKERFKQT